MRASICAISRSRARVSFASRRRDQNRVRLSSRRLILRSTSDRQSDEDGPPPPKHSFGFLSPPNNQGARLIPRQREHRTNARASFPKFPSLTICGLKSALRSGNQKGGRTVRHSF